MTAHQLMAQGMPESSAYRVLKQGWYCPGYNQRDYPQLDGPGGFACSGSLSICDSNSRTTLPI